MVERGSPEDTFLGGTDPRSRPTLEASHADRHVGRKTCQRPDGRAEQRKAPAHAGLGLADPAGGGGGVMRGPHPLNRLDQHNVPRGIWKLRRRI